MEFKKLTKSVENLSQQLAHYESRKKELETGFDELVCLISKIWQDFSLNETKFTIENVDILCSKDGVSFKTNQDILSYKFLNDLEDKVSYYLDTLSKEYGEKYIFN